MSDKEHQRIRAELIEDLCCEICLGCKAANRDEGHRAEPRYIDPSRWEHRYYHENIEHYRLCDAWEVRTAFAKLYPEREDRP